MQSRAQPRNRPGGLFRLILFVGALACGFTLSGFLPGASSQAHAATPAVKKPKPIRPTGYMVDVQDEVMMQNLSCQEIDRFRSKLPDESLMSVAFDILNEPQHTMETSKTLFGGVLTQLILLASGSPDCTMLVPQSAPPNGAACRGSSGRAIVSRGMLDSLSTTPSLRFGELHLLGYFDHAAKLRNCGF